MVEQHRLRSRHVADRDHGKAHRVRVAIRCKCFRPRRSHAPANRVDRDHAKAVRIDRLARPDHPRPPAGFAGNRMRRGDVLVARQRVTDQDRIRRIGIERAIALIGQLDRRERAATIQRERPGQRDSAIEAETIFHCARALAGTVVGCNHCSRSLRSPEPVEGRFAQTVLRQAQHCGSPIESCSARSLCATYARSAIHRSRGPPPADGNCGR